ncbi:MULTISPECIES: YggS family pyridoxal phosphate-dependent enzyme [unclassified Campylobacter]|uniref:YggS family pyridoxal phosphate-dependent enzyme n=1 Tax=unclassified Campylobacter TaxID=2593542 RepID=UPI001BDB0ECD|nr:MULTISPECIES: YggS family pyridoxal phosphate-dependent enzyme [unclassified Campylobacter]MBT0881206.1 YggS family pyridoxal phosphate-dependent enzyme [Campylobacter sp. 2018MI27]MBT0883923.1 YggS family pyridoxal phosphate-dependent enzyme [Campylobacter sp. 2018MI10]
MTYLELKEKYKDIRIIAVSKYTTDEKIMALHKLGQIEFGENKVQDLARKKAELSSDINWHFIGNLQKNKANLLIKTKPIMWQSCINLDLAKYVDTRLDYELDTLLEINVANEDSKAGINPSKAIDEYLAIKQNCKFIKPVGVMCIGAMSDDIKQIIKSFDLCYKIYDELKKDGARICSMGMSSDYEIAIKSGANMIRLGSVLFN